MLEGKKFFPPDEASVKILWAILLVTLIDKGLPSLKANDFRRQLSSKASWAKTINPTANFAALRSVFVALLTKAMSLAYEEVKDPNYRPEIERPELEVALDEYRDLLWTVFLWDLKSLKHSLVVEEFEGQVDRLTNRLIILNVKVEKNTVKAIFLKGVEQLLSLI